jgi:hypothetical protein
MLQRTFSFPRARVGMPSAPRQRCVTQRFTGYILSEYAGAIAKLSYTTP